MGFSNTSTGSTPVLAPSKVEHHLFYCILKNLQTRVCYLSLTLCPGLAGYGEEVLACPGGGQGEQEGEEHLLEDLQPRNPSSPPSLPPHPPLSCNNKHVILS